MPAKVISFINYKGGVGKTTTTYHIGCSLALHHKKKVLLVDADPQTNLTFLCAIPERWKDFREKNGTLASLYRAFLDSQAFDINKILWKSPIQRYASSVVKNLDLIPSDVELLTIDLDLQSKLEVSADIEKLAQNYLGIRTILLDAISPLRESYDYILVDCPPNLYIVTQNALVASQAYVVTTIPDHLSTIGLETLQKKIGELNQRLTNVATIARRQVVGPQLGAIVFVKVRLSKYYPTRFHDEKMTDVSATYPGKCFENFTTEGIGYTEAAEDALPVFVVSDSNAQRVAQQYIDITDEFVNRKDLDP